MDNLSRRAVAAALAVSRNLGLRCSDGPEVIADGSNVLVHLVPFASVVAPVGPSAQRHWFSNRQSNGSHLIWTFAGYLAACNFPVVPPSTQLPAGPHRHEGFALTFWEYIEHDRDYIAGAQEVGPFLSRPP